ncbi:MAG: hypothetical protein HY698_17920 [Deltaproteobacteria bacterium]|nr:hypothetical protein [Deltaproteobacteria bacterium]
MSTVGREFLEELARRHQDVVQAGGAPDPYFRILERRFPVVGSKIDWERVPRAIVRETDPQDPERHARDAATLLLDVVEAEGISEERVVIAIGDSAMEKVVSLPLGVLRASIRDFLELPQHLYVLSEDASWCFSFTMEGDLAFGHAPKP